MSPKAHERILNVFFTIAIGITFYVIITGDASGIPLDNLVCGGFLVSPVFIVMWIILCPFAAAEPVAGIGCVLSGPKRNKITFDRD